MSSLTVAITAADGCRHIAASVAQVIAESLIRSDPVSCKAHTGCSSRLKVPDHAVNIRMTFALIPARSASRQIWSPCRCCGIIVAARNWDRCAPCELDNPGRDNVGRGHGGAIDHLSLGTNSPETRHCRAGLKGRRDLVSGPVRLASAGGVAMLVKIITMSASPASPAISHHDGWMAGAAVELSSRPFGWL